MLWGTCRSTCLAGMCLSMCLTGTCLDTRPSTCLGTCLRTCSSECHTLFWWPSRSELLIGTHRCDDLAAAHYRLLHAVQIVGLWVTTEPNNIFYWDYNWLKYALGGRMLFRWHSRSRIFFTSKTKIFFWLISKYFVLAKASNRACAKVCAQARAWCLWISNTHLRVSFKKMFEIFLLNAFLSFLVHDAVDQF